MSADQLLDPIPLFSAEMRTDPYPFYHRLQELDPVYWSEKFQAWIVTSYDAVAAACNDLRFSSARAARFKELADNDELAPFFSFLEKRMVLADPPLHTRLRGLVTKAFTPHAVESMRPHIQQLVDGFMDRVQPIGRMDVIHDFAFPLPATVIMEMLGIPPDDRDLMKKWSDAFVVFFSDHPKNVTLDQYRKALQSMRDMVAYFRSSMPRIRSSSKECLLHTMAQAEEKGDRLSEEELYANANLLLIVGHETTTNVIGNGVYALLQDPEQFQKLKSDVSLVPGAVEEFLRLVGPIQSTSRIALEDVQLGGKTIRKGQMVFLFLAAANRDPAQFPNPDRLDVTRTTHRHVAFGMGHHFCIGAPLARLEAQIAFSTLLKRLPGIRLASNSVEYNEFFNIRGLRSLPVEFA